MSGKFQDLTAIGVRVIINVGDILLYKEPVFVETWQKYDGYGSSNAGPNSESYQYNFTPFIPSNSRDHIIIESITKGCKSFQEKNRFSLTVEIQVWHSYSTFYN